MMQAEEIVARKAPLRKRLRELVERENRERRDLGASVLQMHRSDDLDEDALGKQAGELAGLQDEMTEIRRELGEPDLPAPAPEGATLPPAAAPPTEAEAEAEEEGAPSSIEELTVQVEDAEQRV